jgi:hypothetical protein
MESSNESKIIKLKSVLEKHKVSNEDINKITNDFYNELNKMKK